MRSFRSFSFSSLHSRLCLLALLLVPLLPLSALAQTPAPPTLIGTPGQPAASAPPTLIGAAGTVTTPISLALVSTGASIGGTTTVRSVVVPAGQPALGPNPLTVTGGTISNQVVTVLPDGRQQVTFAITIPTDKGNKAVVSIPALPNVLPAQFFNTGSFDHSFPAGHRTVTSANKGNVFLGATPAACAPVLTFPNADSKVLAYKVINAQNGTVAAAGSVPTGATSVAVPGLTQFGPYYFYAYGIAAQGQYGAVLGSTAFGLAPPTPAGVNLPGLPSKSAYVQSAPFFDADAAMWGWVQAGPDRYSIYHAANPEAELPNLLTNLSAQKQYYVTGLDGTVTDPVRGRPTLINFVYFKNLPGEAAGVTRAVTTLAAQGYTYFEGPNEPTPNSDSVPLLRAFYAAVHAATLPAGVPVTVLGPAFVTATGGLDNFLAACHGSYPFDELSFHAYNAVNGDYDMGERQMALQDSILAKYGLQNIRRWQTEQAYPALVSGLNTPNRPTAWQAAQTLVFERHHQPVETNYVWHHRANGDWQGGPIWTENFDGSLNGSGYFFRQFVTQTWAKPFGSAYDFGPANALWYADRFDGQGPAAGQSMSVFAGKGTKGESLTLSLSGTNIPSSLTVSDTYGNPTTLAVTSNQVTLPPTTGPTWLCYVPHASSVTLTPLGTDWGTNLALTATVQTPTNQSTASRIVNGIWENGYDFTARAWGSNAAWMASTDQQGTVSTQQAYPYTLTLDLSPVAKTDVTFKRLVIGGPPMWQNMSALTSATLSTGTSASISHVDAQAGAVVTGTAFADPSGPAGGAAPGRGPSNAFDGNTSTIYRSQSNGGYVGLDLGIPTQIKVIRYTTGDQYFEGVFAGAVFEGSNTSATTGYTVVATVSGNPGGGQHTLTVTNQTPYRWWRLRSAAGQPINVGDIQLVSGVVTETVSAVGAGWTLRSVIGQESPLLEIFSDEGTTATQATDYTPQVARWNVVFPSAVTARFVKITVTGTTSGGAGSTQAALYGGQAGPPMVTLGDVEVFAR